MYQDATRLAALLLPEGLDDLEPEYLDDLEAVNRPAETAAEQSSRLSESIFAGSETSGTRVTHTTVSAVSRDPWRS